MNEIVKQRDLKIGDVVDIGTVYGFGTVIKIDGGIVTVERPYVHIYKDDLTTVIRGAEQFTMFHDSDRTITLRSRIGRES